MLMKFKDKSAQIETELKTSTFKDDPSNFVFTLQADKNEQIESITLLYCKKFVSGF